MWKQTLLQMIAAAVPYFAFQVWHDRAATRISKPFYLALFSICSLIIGFVVCASDNRLDMGFMFIPLFIGSLYGGYGAMAVLGSVYAAARLLHDGLAAWSLLELAGVTALVMPLLFHWIGPEFQAMDRRRKQLVLFALMTGVIFVHLTVFALYPDEAGLSFRALADLQGWTYIFLYYATAFVVVYLIENYMDRLRLNENLSQWMTQYRIEAQKLKQFVEEHPFGVIFAERGGVISHLNERARTMLRAGETEDELLGKPYSMLGGYAAGRVMTKLLEQALAGHASATEYAREQSKIYACMGISIRDPRGSGVIGAAVLAQDVTELSLLQGEAERMERLSLVGQMAASITHEIRNPMAVIRGFIQLMRERSPENQREYFRIVMDELDRANGIINDFLSMAQTRLSERSPASLHDLIDDLLPLLMADANMRGLTIELELADEMPLLLLNAKEIKQLILNLCRNGLEAMEERKGTLRIRTRAMPAHVELQVADDGHGIPRERLERLFEPFFTTKTQGTGLGLAMCLGIAERHGGTIRVESEPGAGTTFTVRFDRSAGG
ncbi:two-component system sensor histidine kinase NtrB [Paenibacillus methanolicus]|uniref:histidine kinase n=1 Tax=Paenibacillus methanolicus TaxID=582686 RepID=A0A5S5C0K9_9BACL|nr:ATP-binding protein [Paenibacillus methanolicus]TYP71870.1 signal transduction histidine kinase [Paenibacillus methanolicus]